MPRIKLTKMIPKELVGSSENDFDEGEIIIGNTIEYYVRGLRDHPMVGREFFLDNYKTGIVTEIIADNLFRTKDTIYKYQEVKIRKPKELDADID